MPELPEVETTVRGINKYAKNLSITDVWTDYKSPLHKGKDNIKNPTFFRQFKKNIIGTKILETKRRAKNILIRLSSQQTVLIHMKMTGHLLYGVYRHTQNKKDPWEPEDKNGPLSNPFNRHIHLVFSLSNHKHLVLSDVRKFAKVTFFDTKDETKSPHLLHLGPEPLDRSFTYKVLKQQLTKKQNTPIKTTLLDPYIISGIGNIYSDEILFDANINPFIKVKDLEENNIKLLYKSIKTILAKGVALGGDSTSDYRDITGQKGVFQGRHNVYQKTDSPCPKKHCTGIIVRRILKGRSVHFCPVHQK